ncbi:ATP-binding protein [Aneurinibacillus sp. Ricciae_BoGa-3]|uniref:ATP-binding protein n=1 Tax=Aneurinibacillus sp. Ricciae_BoGa-3 TaxID=3022697 RepID=UPI00234271C8|nr:ATP-binding protein [Aneurinibacillus sp. Ricciae_BoGa-3]WCK55070.1 ATP-binding protein [Aneurinibacillus sp. Ricciae_BoGa-3]
MEDIQEVGLMEWGQSVHFYEHNYHTDNRDKLDFSPFIQPMLNKIMQTHFSYSAEEETALLNEIDQIALLFFGRGGTLSQAMLAVSHFRRELLECIKDQLGTVHQYHDLMQRLLPVTDYLAARMNTVYTRYKSSTYPHISSIFFTEIVDQLPYAIILFDEDMNCEYVNKAFLQAAELSHSDVIGIPRHELLTLLYGEDARLLIDSDPQDPKDMYIDSQRVLNKKFIFLNRIAISSGVEGARNKMLTILWPAKDINANWFIGVQTNMVLDYISDPILMVDELGQIINLNQKMADLLETSQYSLIGQDYEHIFHKHFETDLKESLLISTLHNAEEQLRRRLQVTINGQPRTLLITTRLIRNFNGNVMGALMILRDETEITGLKSHMELMDRYQQIGELAAGFAHEIRNPLTSLKGFLQLSLQDHNFDQREITERILLPEIGRINQIITKFLMMSKPAFPVLKKDNLLELLHYTVDFMTPQAILKDVSLSFVNHAPMALHCQMDREQITQVLINVISNAFDAVGGLESNRKVQVSLGMHKDHAVIEIRDNGCGFEHDEIDKAFDPFFTRKVNGTGLGLAVSRQIVFRHGGQIEIESVKNDGTCVRIALPLTGAA